MRIIYFTQEHCHSCSIQEEQFQLLKTPVHIERYDTATHWSVFQDFGINQTPVLVLMDGNTEVGRRIGPVYAEDLQQWINP